MCVWFGRIVIPSHVEMHISRGGSGISNIGLNFVQKQMDRSTDRLRILAEGAIALSVTLSGGALFAS